MKKELSYQYLNITKQFVEQLIRKILVEELGNDYYLLPEFLKKHTNHIPLQCRQFGWFKISRDNLRLFYKLLKANGLISKSITYLQFKPHFYGNQSIFERIRWCVNTNELVYLFDRLREEGIITTWSDPHVLICEHFLDKNRKKLDPNNLRSSLNNGVKQKKRVEILEGIIKELLKPQIDNRA